MTDQQNLSTKQKLEMQLTPPGPNEKLYAVWRSLIAAIWFGGPVCKSIF